MPLAPRNPNTIYLGGGSVQGGGDGLTVVNTNPTSAVATPGMLAQLHDVSGVAKYRPHATASGKAAAAFYLERPELNQGIDDDYPADTLARIGIGQKGSVFYALIPSGENVVAGDLLESNGDGYLKEGTTAPVVQALDSPGAVTVATRVRVEVL